MKPLHLCFLPLFFFVFFLKNAASQNGTESFPPNLPGCAFDETNHLHPADLQQEIEDYVQQAIPVMAAQTRSAAEPLLSVAVVVHVIHEGEPVGTGRNISDAQIQAQIDILNEDFASLNRQYFDTPAQWMGLAGVPNIQFVLANVSPGGGINNGIDRVQMTVTGTSWSNNNINTVIKPATVWDAEKYLNIWVLSIPGTTAAGGVVGYSNYPTPSQTGSASDGPVIDFNWFGAPGFPASGYRPVTHELGHYFGLPHTFNGSSCNSDDNIEDTPNVDASTREYMQDLNCGSGYPTGPSSCGNDHLYVNYMDYVSETCYTSFTQGQVNVMRSVLEGSANQFNYGSRASLLANAPQVASIPANDAGIVRLLSPADNYCTADSIAPVVTLRNFGTQNLTSVKIAHLATGGWPIEMNWQGDLAPGQNVEVTLPKFLPPNGSYTLEIFTQNPNGEADDRPANDLISADQSATVAIRPPVIEDFENETGFPTGTGMFPFNQTNDNLFWDLNAEASGFGEGSQSVVIDNHSAFNQPGTFGSLDALITRHFDLSEMNGTELKFDLAYAPFGAGQLDTLLVLVATECSQNFNQLIFAKGGNTLATAPATQQVFTPNASQWRTESIDLSAFDGMDDVTIAFVNIAGWGNRLFLDNIKVGVSCSALSVNWQKAPNGCAQFCSGTAEVDIPVSNGGLNYRWEGWPVEHNHPNIYQLCPGEVTVTITDAFGCEIIASTEIGQSPTPVATTASTEVSTFGENDGTATVNVSSGTPPFAFSWSNGANANSNDFSHTITNLPEGEYSVTVTDATDCSSVFEASVGSVCGAFGLTVQVGQVNCFGAADGMATALPMNGEGPYQYLWSNGANTQTISDLDVGEYSVTLTDENACPAENTVTITQPPSLILTTTSTDETALGANNGSVSAEVEGGTPGYEYLWSNGADTPSQNNLPPGTYGITVTDAAQCVYISTVVVQPFTCEDFTAVISWENVDCFGDSTGTAMVEVTGAAQPVTYAWSNGGEAATVDNLTAGSYTVSVSDAAGCMAELVASVLQPPLLSANVSSTDETMSGAEDGTAAVNPSGGLVMPGSGYQVLWSNDETAFSIENLAPGFYFVTVTDANNCEAVDTVLVNAVGCNLSIQTSVSPSSCPNVADGLAMVTEAPGGAMPLTYAWSNGDMDSFAENLLPDTYAVTVTDANGCSTSQSVTITAEDTEAPNLMLQDVTLQLDENGFASLTAEMVDLGSSDNCSMVDLVLSQNEFDCFMIGEMLVEVSGTDESGNTATDTVVVNVTDLLPPTISCPEDFSMLTCDTVFYEMPTVEDNCGEADLQITEGFASGEVFPAGTTLVSFVATDFAGNTDDCSFTVTVEYDLSTDIMGTDPTCAGFSDGVIDLFINGGMSPYMSEWSHGGSPGNLPAGDYGVTVTDQNGCTTENSVTLEDPPPFSAEVVNVVPANDSDTPGSISVSINGGVPPWGLAWSENGVALPGFDPAFAPPGNYAVVITDTYGCEIVLSDILVDNLNSSTDRPLDAALEIFPNPTGEVFFVEIKTENPGPAQLELYDATGKRHVQAHFTPTSHHTEKVDVSTLPSGVYWLKIQMGTGLASRKVVVF